MNSVAIDRRTDLRFSRRGTREGFTLTELLIVIVIIVVLASVVFVMARRGIQSARSAQCTNNIRNVVLSHLQISQDNNGVIVHAWRSNAFGSRPRNWSEHHAIYSSEGLDWNAATAKVLSKMKSMDYLQCPVAARERRTDMLANTTHGSWRTYAMNQWVGAISDSMNPQFGFIDGAVTTTQVEEPAKLIFVTEKSWGGATGYTPVFGPDAGPKTYADHHDGRLNVGYFDGHVDQLKPEELPLKGTTLPSGEVVNLRNSGAVQSSLIWRGRSRPRPAN